MSGRQNVAGLAGDAELPALARQVLAEKLDERKAIKQLIREWRADHLRA